MASQPKISHRFLWVENVDKNLFLLYKLDKLPKSSLKIVLVENTHVVKELAPILELNAVAVSSYHAGLSEYSDNYEVSGSLD